MKRLIIKLFLSLCLWAVLPVCAQDAVHYYFRTMDIRNGLSQNTGKHSINSPFHSKNVILLL